MAAKKRVTKSTVAKNVKLNRRVTDVEPVVTPAPVAAVAEAAKPVEPRVAAAEEKAAAFGATVRTNVAKGFGVAVGAAAFSGAVAFAVSRGLFRGIRG